MNNNTELFPHIIIHTLSKINVETFSDENFSEIIPRQKMIFF